MSSTQPAGAGSGRSTAPIADALDKNKQVAQEVKDVADELAVVHAVLDQKLPLDAAAADVAQAVARTNHLEKRLAASGEALDEVNATLERAIPPGHGAGAR